jgi:HEPN domain-containing protein
MLPDNPEPGSAGDWLRRAKSDLALASVPRPPDVMYNKLCFHAQQAVEKSLKAMLIAEHIEFPRVHHIGYLLGLLPQEINLPIEKDIQQEE